VADRKNGPGNVLSFTLTHSFSPTLINEFIFGTGRGGVTIAPSDDRATRSATGINTPLLFTDANEPNLIPTITLGTLASASALPTTSVFGTFDQRFVINNFIDNLTKVSGKHAFKFGFYYQRASNASNSQNHVQSDIDFANSASNPLNTGYAFAVGDNTWHSADPVGAEVETRDSILLTYFVDAGLLRFLRNRGKRVGNFVLNEVKHLGR